MTLQELIEAIAHCDRIVLLLESPQTGCIHELDLPRDAAIAELRRLGATTPRFYAPRVDKSGPTTTAYVGPVLDPG